MLADADDGDRRCNMTAVAADESARSSHFDRLTGFVGYRTYGRANKADDALWTRVHVALGALSANRSIL